MRNHGLIVAAIIGFAFVSALASDTPPIKAGPGDVDAVKHVLAVAESKPQGTALADAISKIADPSLKQQVQALLPELTAAADKHSRVVEIVTGLKASGGITELAPGGPAWLRTLVGDDAMHLFDRLITVNINDRQSPHNKAYHLLETVRDDWCAQLDGMTDIVNLDLANTNIKGPGLKYIGTLTNLENLNLTLCPVTDEYLQNLSNLSKMKRFGLASAGCNGTGFKYLGKMTQLENLNFHHTPVNDDGLREICRMTSLERLEIVHCFWTDSGAADLVNLKNMQRLQLGSLKATGASVAFLKQMPKLKELDLHDMKDAPLAVHNASEIPTLTVLRLYINPVKDEQIEELAKLPNLEELALGGAQLTDAGVAHLGSLKKLKKLTLGGTKISSAAMEKLKAALPSLEIAK